MALINIKKIYRIIINNKHRKNKCNYNSLEIMLNSKILLLARFTVLYSLNN